MYTGALHIKRLIYYQRSSFSGSELHVSYDWQALAPNTHCGLFLRYHFVHTVKLEILTVLKFGSLS